MLKVIGIFIIVVVSSIFAIKYLPYEKGDEYYPFFDGNNTASDEIKYSTTIGQTFKAHHDFLNRIDITFATYARENTHNIILHLREKNNDKDVAVLEINAKSIENNVMNSLYFNPIPDSKDRFYYFYLESPTSTTGNAVAVWVKTTDTYKDGEFIENGKTTNGDILFRPYYKTNLEDYFHSVLTRIPLFKPEFENTSFLFVLILCYIIFTFLIVTLILKNSVRTNKNYREIKSPSSYVVK